MLCYSSADFIEFDINLKTVQSKEFTSVRGSYLWSFS